MLKGVNYDVILWNQYNKIVVKQKASYKKSRRIVKKISIEADCLLAVCGLFCVTSSGLEIELIERR